MEPGLTRIPVQSRRQAMDWSLVLVSQGIETIIDRPADENGWGLLVPAHEFQHAINTLRQYRKENRAWPWQQQVFHRFTFDWTSLAWVGLVAFFFWLDSMIKLKSAGWMLGNDVGHGQWWRLFTAVWLHADAGHLATNAVFGFVLLGLAMGHYGTGLALLSAYCAGVVGNLGTGFLSAQSIPSLGASGMVMGSLGLIAVQSFAFWQQEGYRWKHALSAVAGGAMLFVLLGLAPDSDVLAHLGGFMAGLLFGGILTLLSFTARRAAANLIAGLCFCILVVVPWWLALSHLKATGP
jgi:rhomboid protease GluP